MKLKYLQSFTVLLGFVINAYSQNQSVPTNGLVAFYHLDGSAADSSGMSNDGSLHSVPPVSDRFGRTGKACYFNGSSGYIDIPTSSSLQPITTVSIGAWIKPDSVSTAACVISKRFSLTNDPYHSYEITYNPNKNRWAFAVSKGLAGSLKLLNGRTDPTWGSWTYITGTYDGSIMKLYVNGTLDTSFAASGNLGYGAIPLYIGYSGSSTDYFKGSIDEVTVYNRALTAQEISSMYNGTVGIEQLPNNEASVNLYPNPVSNQLLIDVNGVQIEGYIISDMTGKQIQIGSFRSQLDVANLNKGVYFISFINKESRIIKSSQFTELKFFDTLLDLLLVPCC